jgi:NADH-quinone oxidoreductase subunit N
MEGGYLNLAVKGILTSLFSAYYYLKVVYFMFMRNGVPELHQDKWTLVIMVGAAALIVLLGLMPGIAAGLVNIPPLL